jgi:hypothetical protein
MYTFFHGWRRKAGCVALLMALAFSGLWIRSQVVQDTLIRFTHDGIVGLFARAYGVSWTRHTQWPPEYLSRPAGSWEFASYETPPYAWDRYDNDIVIWRWQLLGFDFGERQEAQFLRPVVDWTIPYWSVAVPLTLLSGYLIVWTPRKVTTPVAGPSPQLLSAETR